VKTLKLHLNREYKSVLSYVRKRVKDYPFWVNLGPGEDEDPVSLITIGYFFDEDGWWLTLVFDTRPGARPDGMWNHWIEENWLKFRFDFNLDKADMMDVKHYDPKWNEPKLMNEPRFVALLGNLCRDVLKDARQRGWFKDLPLAAKCAMNVEEMEGRYGWPAYKSLDTVGRVSK
jgi:hypothetical protein